MIFGNPLCHHCSEVDSISHFLVECKYLDPFWSKVVDTFKQCGINTSVRNLFHLIIGYNIDFVDYDLVNIILSYIGFVIHKAHFCSEQNLILSLDVWLRI